MKMKRLVSKLRGMKVVACSLALTLVLGGTAFATSHSFGYTLPGYQENVTVQAGNRPSSSYSADDSVYSGGTRKLWLWCDAPSVNNRVSNSVLVTGNTSYSISYWNRSSGDVYLRGCTDGWQEPNYISGFVVF